MTREKSIIDLIEEFYDDFENRTCKNCKYYTKCKDGYNYCDKQCLLNGIITDDFGCNKWEAKDD